MRRLLVITLAFALAAGAQTAYYPTSIVSDSGLFVASDRAQTTLRSSITAASTTISVANGSRFRASQLVTIDDSAGTWEIVRVCLVNGNTLSIGSSTCPNTDGRGFAGTTAASHAIGSRVSANNTHWHWNQMREEMKAVQTHVGTPTGGHFSTGLNLTGPFFYPRGTSLPATCTVGQGFFKTDAVAGQNLYSCTGTNTWTQMAGAGVMVYPAAGIAQSTGSAWGSTLTLDIDSSMAANSDAAIPSQKAVKSALDGKVATSRTVNGHALSSNVTVSKSDVGLGNVANADTTDAANISTGTLPDARLSANVVTKASDVITSTDVSTPSSPSVGHTKFYSKSGALCSLDPYGNENCTTALGTDIDFSLKNSTRPSKIGTSLPGTCFTGETYLKTDATTTSMWYVCTSTNTWTQQTGTGGVQAYPTAGVPQSTGSAWGSSLTLDTDSTMAANSDTRIATQKAVKTALGTKAASNASTTVNGQTCALGGTCTVASGLPSGCSSPGTGAITCSGVITAGSFSGSSTSVSDLTPTVTSGTVATIAAGKWGVGNVPSSTAGSALTLQTLTVSGATNASPIVLTVNNMTGMSLRNGDTVIVTGVAGNTAANGTWTVEIDSSTQFKLTGSTGNGAYTTGGTITTTGAGSILVYGTGDNVIHYDFTAALGTVATCTNNCVMNQVASPTFPAAAVPIATYTVTAGAIASVVDQRRFLSNRGIEAGTGISVSDAGGAATVSITSDVATKSGANTFTGANTFASATQTTPNKVGTSLPATCSVGQTYFKSNSTAGENLHLCTATNTWTQVTSGAANGGFWAQTFPASRCTAGLAVDVMGAGYKLLGGSGHVATCNGDSGYLRMPSEGYILTAGAIPSGWTNASSTIAVTLVVEEGDNTAATIAIDVSLACSNDGDTATPTFSTASTVTWSAAGRRRYAKTVTPAIPAGCAAGSVLEIKMVLNGSNATTPGLVGTSIKVTGF